MNLPKSIIMAMLVIFSLNCTYCDDIKQQFEQLFQEYKILRVKQGHRSYLPGGDKIIEISELGTQIIPLFFEKLNENQDDRGLFSAFTFLWTRTVRKSFDREIIKPLYENNDPHAIIKVHKTWWDEGRKDTPKQYQAAYASWKQLKKEGKNEEAELALKKIRNMGRIVIPFLLENLKQGDNELLPIVVFLTHKSLKTASTEECIEWCEKNREKWYIEIPKDDEAEAMEN